VVVGAPSRFCQVSPSACMRAPPFQQWLTLDVRTWLSSDASRNTGPDSRRLIAPCFSVFPSETIAQATLGLKETSFHVEPLGAGVVDSRNATAREEEGRERR
jgi:hypothetical protein